MLCYTEELFLSNFDLHVYFRKKSPENTNTKETKHTSERTITYVRIVVFTVNTRMFIFGVRINVWLYAFPHFTTIANICCGYQRPEASNKFCAVITPSKFNLDKFKHSVILLFIS